MAWAGAGLVGDGCAAMVAESEPDAPVTALDQQRQDGWDVGSERRPLAFPGAQATDAAGNPGWRDTAANLASRLAPAGLRWAPYYNPTLFQSLETPRGADLRAAIRPISTPEMTKASARGQAMLSLLSDKGVCRGDVAVVLDLPGPESIAVAAALAPCLEPVFIFANWPHPVGVVPAHLTLGAAIYELPIFERQRSLRRPDAAPMFVLDSLRLAPYRDDAGAFDNRYFAGLPAPATLRSAGISRILYVTPDDHVALESDDLNDDLVALDRGGIEVQMLALSDFSETPLPSWPDLPPDDSTPVFVGPAPRFFFGGSPARHRCFWHWYGWPSAAARAGTAPVTVPPPLSLAPRLHFHPALRATFASGVRLGSGHFGRLGSHGVSLGQIHLGRSGSLGRAHFGTSG